MNSYSCYIIRDLIQWSLHFLRPLITPSLRSGWAFGSLKMCRDLKLKIGSYRYVVYVACTMPSMIRAIRTLEALYMLINSSLWLRFVPFKVESRSQTPSLGLSHRMCLCTMLTIFYNMHRYFHAATGYMVHSVSYLPRAHAQGGKIIGHVVVIVIVVVVVLAQKLPYLDS